MFVGQKIYYIIWQFTRKTNLPHILSTNFSINMKFFFGKLDNNSFTSDKWGKSPFMQPSAIAPRTSTAASLSFQASSFVLDNLACPDTRKLLHIRSICNELPAKKVKGQQNQFLVYLVSFISITSMINISSKMIKLYFFRFMQNWSS